jgi:phospholipid-translocating ATPase
MPNWAGVNNGKPNFVSTRRFTLSTWLPKSCFMQFKRSANQFFLVVSILVILPFSPTWWPSTSLPFICVILWTAGKDLFEDMRRKRDDDAENNRLCLYYDFKSGSFANVPWMSIRTGDFLLTFEDDALPADVLVVQPCQEEAFVSTVNLDGETNLKTRQPLELFTGILEKDDPKCDRDEACKRAAQKVQLLREQGLTCYLDAPKSALTELGGRVALSSKSKASAEKLGPSVDDHYFLNYEHFVPRGCVLRNTPYLLSIACYCGNDTKTRLNVQPTGAKISNMQRSLNVGVRCLIAVVILFSLYIATAGEIALSEKDRSDDPRNPINDPNDHNFFKRFMIYWIVLYQMVPISLYVCFEMVKLLLGAWINLDKSMVDPDPPHRGAVARTADLIEELGQVNFVFSDKTGTLTDNSMIFARACIDSMDVGEFRRPGERKTTQELVSQVGNPANLPPGPTLCREALARTSGEDLNENGQPGGECQGKGLQRAEVRWYFMSMAVCHTVQAVVEEGDQIKYTGSSPDEVAFCYAAHAVGVSFVSRRRSPGQRACEVIVQGPAPEGRHTFKVLCELPFTSDRKRMTVVCEYQGQLFCISKGADNVMAPLCDEPFDAESLRCLEDYSKQGLRTLVFASKALDRNQYDTWRVSFDQAMCEGADRDAKVGLVALELENQLILTGISAIEDRLQQGVPDAIVSIKAAGIRFWVLTGDKTETAVEIVRACNLFTPEMTLAYMTSATSEEHAMKLMSDAKEVLSGNTEGGLVIDGTFVKWALGSTHARALLYELAAGSRSCVCCRLSPEQKRGVVELVKEQNKQGITLAIGDGANDVSMIQGAHIGIGIRGKEGNQAVQSSDIAISQFRFLVPLLLLHGRRAYRRVATFLCFYLYKHVVLATVDAIWAHQYKFKGAIAFNEYLSSLYSALFTSLPVIVILCWDVDLPDAVALRSPHLYVEGVQRMRFNARVFVIWMICAVWHGSLAWLVPSLFVGGTYPGWFSEGYVEMDYVSNGAIDFWRGSVCSFTLVITFVYLRLWMNSLNPFSPVVLGVFFISGAAYIIVLFFFGHIDFLTTMFGYQLRGIPTTVFSDWKYLSVILLTPLALLLDFFLIQLGKLLRPSPLDIARRHKNKNVDSTTWSETDVTSAARSEKEADSTDI